MIKVPMPPERVAAIPASEPAAPPKLEYGIDIGGSSSTAVLRARWSEVKANFGPQMAGLRPLIAHDRRVGHLPYRLVIGPVPNSAAATGLCGQFRLARGRCRAARFVGEPLAQP